MLEINDKNMSFSGTEDDLANDLVHCVDIIMVELYHRRFKDLSYLSLNLIEVLENYADVLDSSEFDDKKEILN